MAAGRARLAALILLAAGCAGDDADRPRLAEGALPDGTHFGLVTAIDGEVAVLAFDPAELVDGEVENADDQSFRLPISEEVVVRLLEPCCELHEHDLDDWVAGFEPDNRSFYGTSASRYELTIDAGEVVRVEEVLLDD